MPVRVCDDVPETEAVESWLLLWVCESDCVVEGVTVPLDVTIWLRVLVSVWDSVPEEDNVAP